MHVDISFKESSKHIITLHEVKLHKYLRESFVKVEQGIRQDK